jgi:hypothetical protein
MRVFRALLNHAPQNADNSFVTGTCRQSVPGVRTGRNLPLVRNQENTTIIRQLVARWTPETHLKSASPYALREQTTPLISS